MLCLVPYFVSMGSGLFKTALTFSLFSFVLFFLFYGAALIAAPGLIVWGVLIWLVGTGLLTAMFYRRKKRGDRNANSSGSGCGGGCVTYTGGSFGGDGGGSGDSGGSGGDGGSGCGGGCGGGD